MKQDKNILGFTLVEVLVAMTLFGLIIVSVLMIFTLSTQISLKTDMHREMQQNIKSVVEAIADDIRKNGIESTFNGIVWDTLPTTPIAAVDIETEGLETKASEGAAFGNKYFLGDYQNVISGLPTFTIPANQSTTCSQLKEVCVMLKSGVGPLSNGQISFTSLKFYVTPGLVPKVTIVAKARPAAKRGVRSSMIKNAEITFQTTVSERILRVK